jgi:hypothetical protein
MSIKVTRYPVCRHTLTNGRRCKSLAMTTSAFCYHHQKIRRTRPRTITMPAAPALIRFNPLRDARSLQHALSLILQGVASGQLPTGPAGRMLSVIEKAFAACKENQYLSPNPFENDILPISTGRNSQQ